MRRTQSVGKKISRTAKLGLLIGLAIGATACGGGSSESTSNDEVPASTETTLAPSTTEAAQAEVDDSAWAEELAVAVDAQNAVNNEMSDSFGFAFTGGPDQLTAEVEALRETAERSDALSFPPAPADGDLAELYDRFLTANRAWIDDFRTGAETIEANATELLALWTDDGPPQEYLAISDPIYDRVGEYAPACSALADKVLEATGVSIDCLGRDTNVVEDANFQLGELELTIAGAERFTVEQESDVRVHIHDFDDEFVAFDLASEPRFADPNGELRDLGVEGDIGWPADFPSWVEALGGVVVSTGIESVGPFPAEYWDLTRGFESVEELSDNSIVSIIARSSSDNTDVVQLVPFVVFRIYKIDTPTGPVLGSFAGEAFPEGDGPPAPSSAMPDSALEWAATVRSAIQQR